MANAGPLTTTFTAPASCTTATGLYQIWESKTYHFEQGPLASMTDCFPSGYDAAATSQYYSPGVCPGGYTTACSSTDVVSSTVTETAYTCCPTGRVQYTCAASGAKGSLGCTTMFGGNIGISLLTAISGSSTYSTAVIGTAGQGIGAHSIAVRMQAGDPTGSTVLATATSEVASSPQSTTSSSVSTGLSTVGIAGIGVGAGALVLAISGILGFLLWMRRRKQRATRNTTPLHQQYSTPDLPHRGPLPPRPPRPIGAPPLGPRAPPPAPPPKDPCAYPRPPMSPSPSTTSSKFKKAREMEILKVRNVEIRKQPRGDGASSKKSRDTTSTFGTLLNGPFELPGEFADDSERKKQQHMYEMYELYGEWPQSPTSTTTTTTNNNQNPGVLSSSKSFETFKSAELMGSIPTSPKRPSDAAHGYFWAAPPSYGAQPAELEEPRPRPVVKPQKSFEAAHRHRRMPSGRWGMGTSWAPAELPTPDERGFV